MPAPSANTTRLVGSLWVQLPPDKRALRRQCLPVPSGLSLNLPGPSPPGEQAPDLLKGPSPECRPTSALRLRASRPESGTVTVQHQQQDRTREGAGGLATALAETPLRCPPPAAPLQPGSLGGRPAGAGLHLPDTCWDTLLSRDWQWRLENTERRKKKDFSGDSLRSQIPNVIL